MSLRDQKSEQSDSKFSGRNIHRELEAEERSIQEETEENVLVYDQHPYGKSAVGDFVDDLAPYVNQDILIAGSGAGTRALPIATVANSITAIDRSDESIDVLNAAAGALAVDIETEVKDLQEWSAPMDAYDRILCMGVLHHLENQKEVLKQLARAVRPDGQIELLVYHRRSPVYYERQLIETLNNVLGIKNLVPESIKEDIEWWDKFENPKWDGYTPEEVRAWCRSADLAVKDTNIDGEVFGDLTLAALPPIVRMALEKTLDQYRFEIHIEATPK